MISRRQLVRSSAGLGALAALGGLAACGDPAEAKRLAFLNWQDYIDPKLLRDFEGELGGPVTYETYASNDELARRLGQASGTRRRGRKGSSFDLIVPSDNLLRRLRDADALRELPRDLVGLENLDPSFRRADFDPGNRFSVPWATGTTGIGYSATAFPDGPPDWSAFESGDFSGKSTLLDETRDAMAVALWLIDEDPNTRDSAAITAAGRKLAELRRGGVAFDAATYLRKLRDGDVVLAQAYSSDVEQARADNPDLAFVVPIAGGLRWIDSLCIPTDAPHPESAERFIEFYLRPQVSAANAVEVRVDTANQAAREFVPEELLSEPAVYPPPETLERLVFTEALDDDIEGRYAKAFDTAKA